MELPKIWHDTRHILDVNARACELFRCDREDLIDQTLESGVYGEDMRFLLRLRMQTIREKGELPERIFPFLRTTGSVFWADVKTVKESDGVWMTTLRYKSEY